MDETTEQVLDTAKFMEHYGRLSNNKLEAEVSKSFATQVKKEVQDAQDRADQIVNALTSRSKPPDFPVARSALALLAKASKTLIAHWQPFIIAVAEVLPAREEGEADAQLDIDVEAPAVQDLRAALGSIGAVLPVASSRELRALREGFAQLGDAIAIEFGKRGIVFERDGSAALLERLNAEIEYAARPDALPKDFAFSDRRLMSLRAEVDGLKLQLVQADERILELRAEHDPAAVAKLRAEMGGGEIGEAGIPATEPELRGVIAEMKATNNGLHQQLAAVTLERDGAQKTRDEMAKAADNEVMLREKAEQALGAEKKRAGELEHEVEMLKKKSSKLK